MNYLSLASLYQEKTCAEPHLRLLCDDFDRFQPGDFGLLGVEDERETLNRGAFEGEILIPASGHLNCLAWCSYRPWRALWFERDLPLKPLGCLNPNSQRLLFAQRVKIPFLSSMDGLGVLTYPLKILGFFARGCQKMWPHFFSFFLCQVANAGDLNRNIGLVRGKSLLNNSAPP